MYQRCFDSAAETIFEQDKTPRFSRFVISDDPNWESGHHMHDNETELIYVKKGIARLIIDSSLYVAHADDIVVVERGAATRCSIRQQFAGYHLYLCAVWVLFSRLGRKPTIAESFLSGGFRGSGERGH
ncbi:AraC family transcriptional regulator [Salmonella enterica subsp. enterica]|nr:AraC family transcriptional regulator [Salmonella enterica subsp. enterica]